MESVWDETEVSAISAYPVDYFGSTRRLMDSLVTAEDRRSYKVDAMRVALEQLARFDDEELQGRRLRTLRACIEEAGSVGVPVSNRLLKLAQPT